MFRGPATEHHFKGTSSTILQSGELRINSDTDSPPLAPCPLYSRFIRSAVTALDNIGDSETTDTLRAVMRNKNMNRELVKKALDEIKKGEIKEKGRTKKIPPKKKVEYSECDVPSGDGVCSDNNCPCPEVEIPRGTGYLYISQELVDSQPKYPNRRSAREVMQRK